MLSNALLLTFTGVIAIATVVALFRDQFLSWIWKPTLKVTIEPRPPDCHKTSWWRLDDTPGPCYYYRLRVTNDGNAAARDVEIFVRDVERKTSKGQWISYEKFIPQYLVWAVTGRPTHIPRIFPETERHCDLAHVLKPDDRRGHPTEDHGELPPGKTAVSLDVNVHYLRRGHLLPPGEYKLFLDIAGANVKAKKVTLILNNPGVWLDDEAQMLKGGVEISVSP